MPIESSENKNPPKFSLEVWDNTVKGLTSFKEFFHPKADVIYYPSCGPDISVTKVFPESRIIFVDGNEHITKWLTEAGFEAHTEPSQTFTPDAPVDILLLVNPVVNPDKPFEVLQESGFLVCNNKHGTATLKRDDPNFTLRGVVLDGGMVEIDKLGECWEYVDSDEELKKDFRFPMIVNIVKQITGNESNIVEEYKKILQNSENGGTIINGKYTPLFNLPRKKEPYLFIFEKKLKTSTNNEL